MEVVDLFEIILYFRRNCLQNKEEKIIKDALFG